LASGDLEGYRDHCQQALARFESTTNPGTADTIAKACLLLPTAGLNSGRLGRLADVAVTQGSQSEFLPWFKLCKALAEYRLGNFANSVTWARQALDSAGAIPERDAAAWLVLSMAQKRLGQDSTAKASLSEAVRLIDRELPKLDSGDLGAGWINRIIADLLFREATPTVEGESPQTTPP